MRQTGGMAVGETSTRSRPRSRATLKASKGAMMPSWTPFSSMTRISRARMRSLMRIKDFAERLSSAMALLRRNSARRRSRTTAAADVRTQREYSIVAAATELAAGRRNRLPPRANGGENGHVRKWLMGAALAGGVLAAGALLLSP